MVIFLNFQEIEHALKLIIPRKLTILVNKLIYGEKVPDCNTLGYRKGYNAVLTLRSPDFQLLTLFEMTIRTVTYTAQWIVQTIL